MIRMDFRLEPIYGLMRMAVLKETALQGQFADSDRVKLAELANWIKTVSCWNTRFKNLVR